MSNFQAKFRDRWLRHLLWNCPNMKVTGLHWWSVNVGSGNGLVPSGNKPLPEPMLTQTFAPYGVTGPQWVNDETFWWLMLKQHLIVNFRVDRLDGRGYVCPIYNLLVTDEEYFLFWTYIRNFVQLIYLMCVARQTVGIIHMKYCTYLFIWIAFEMAPIYLKNSWETGKISYHYRDVIMATMAPQITSLAIVYSTGYSGADQRKHQSSASLAFVRWIHRGPVNSRHKWPVTRKMFPFDDVIMWILYEIHMKWKRTSREIHMNIRLIFHNNFIRYL